MEETKTAEEINEALKKEIEVLHDAKQKYIDALDTRIADLTKLLEHPTFTEEEKLNHARFVNGVPPEDIAKFNAAAETEKIDLKPDGVIIAPGLTEEEQNEA